MPAVLSYRFTNTEARMAKHITLADLAKQLRMDRSSLLKAVKKLGIPTMRVRSLNTRGQASLAVSLHDAEAIRKHYSWRLDN